MRGRRLSGGDDEAFAGTCSVYAEGFDVDEAGSDI